MYYQGYFESFGFEPARADNLAFEISAHADNSEIKRLAKLADRLRQRGWIKIRGADLEHWEDEVDRVYGVINKACNI